MKHYGLTTRSVVTQRNFVHHKEGKKTQVMARQLSTVAVLLCTESNALSGHTRRHRCISTSVHSNAVLHFNVGVGH